MGCCNAKIRPENPEEEVVESRRRRYRRRIDSGNNTETKRFLFGVSCVSISVCCGLISMA